MARKVTYDQHKLPVLKQRLHQINLEFKKLGYGSKSHVARWLIKHGYQEGDSIQVAKKISHLLNGYVRGIHPRLRNGGVWRPEEAERMLRLLEKWLKTEAQNLPKGPMSREERIRLKKEKNKQREKPPSKPRSRHEVIDDEF